MKYVLLVSCFLVFPWAQASLQLSHETESKIVASYWEIEEVSLNSKKSQVFVKVCLYKDADAALEKASPIKCVNKMFGAAAFNTVSSTLFPLIETRLKNHVDKFFENATSQ